MRFPPRGVIERAIMLPSLHDDFLVSYEVNCETRQIKLRAKRDPRVPTGNEEPTNHTIVINGVEGYHIFVGTNSRRKTDRHIRLSDQGVLSHGGRPRSLGGRSRFCATSAHGNGHPRLHSKFFIWSFWLDTRQGSLGRAKVAHRGSSCASASAARGTRRGIPTSWRAAPAAHEVCTSRPLHCSRAPPTGSPRSRWGCRPSRNPRPDRPRP